MGQTAKAQTYYDQYEQALAAGNIEQAQADYAAYQYHAGKEGGSFWDQARGTIESLGLDAAAVFSGQEWAIPLINAGVTAANGGTIGQDLLAGGEALAGQELAGAVGIGSGNSVFNNALGITWDNPTSLGLPNVGGAVNNALGAVGNTLGFNSSGVATPVAGDVTATGQPVDAQGQPLTSTPGAGVSSGASSGAPTSASNVSNLSSAQVNAPLGENLAGTSTSASPDMGSINAPSQSFTNAFNQEQGGTPQLSSGTSFPDLATTTGSASDSSLQSAGSGAVAAPANIAPAEASSFPGDIGGAVPLGGDAISAIGGASTGGASNAALGAVDSGASSAFVQGFGPAPALTGDFPSTDFSNLGPSPADGTDTGSWKDFLPKKSDVGKFALSAIPSIGLGAYEAIKGPPPLPKASAPLQPGGALTAPLLATEQSGVNAYNSGTLTAPQQASILQGVQQQQNQLLQQIASSGSTDPTHDSRYIEGMKSIQQWALAQQQAMLQQDLTNAFTAAGQAGTDLTNVAGQQITQDTNFQNALSQALGGLVSGTVATRTAA